jgi:DNA-binding GntR family transcriptional regulator
MPARPRRASTAGSRQPAYRTKSEIARQHIQELILSGKARAGDHITTREVSRALGMSDTPVREALRSLAAQQWLELQAHHGGIVASIQTGQLAEIYAVRGVLGAAAIELGGALYTPKQLNDLQRNLDHSAAAVAAGDIPRYTRLNRQFHLLLSDTPATQWTLRLLTTTWIQSAAVGRGFELIPGRIERSLREHEAILKAIRKKDFTRAAALMNDHERRAGTELIAALAAQGG